ncbi:unnamed protein product [Sphagnum balticum]
MSLQKITEHAYDCLHGFKPQSSAIFRCQKKCCRGMDPMTFTRPVLSMCGTMTFVKLLNPALSSSLQHYECSAPTSSRQLCLLGNGIDQA